MSERGATRPMVLDFDGNESPGAGSDSPQRMLVEHHRKTIWIPWTLILLGGWLVLAPFTFGYLDSDLWQVPSGGRGAWFADEVQHLAGRAELMAVSDVVCGVLLAVLGWRALTPDRPASRWAACLVGVWLVFAPVVLWSPTAAGYVNDSFIGMLVIALTILIPGMPNMVAFTHMGPASPGGWSYNPSTWPQRAILIALGFAGMLVSRYLGAYQLGYIDSVWDPFFGFADGTRPVLDSSMSHMWPISDAALGGVAYTFEFLMGFMGSKSRWRTMPWMVAMFGILVIPLGLSHIALVMSQPVVVHHWSTLALLAAAVMLPMITLTVDEVVAMGQHMRAGVRRGDRGGSAWKVFWMGGQPGDATDGNGADVDPATAGRIETARAMVRGATAPPSLLVLAAIGVWMLAAPAAFDVSIRSGAADVAHIGGAVVLVAAVVAMGEPVRRLRFVAGAAGVAVAAIVWVTGPDAGYGAAMVVTGLAAAVASVPRGVVRDRYADWVWFTR